MPTSDNSQQQRQSTSAAPRQENFHHQSTSSRLSYFQPHSSSAAARITLSTTPNYHHHQQPRLLLNHPPPPLIFPPNGGGHFNSHHHSFNHHQHQHQHHHHNHHHHHHHDPASVSALTATATAASGAPNGSFQSLSPDARACFTATYLCVLIVNNTWLDCNLLEMLCNGTTTTLNKSSSGGASSQSNSDKEDDDHSESNQSGNRRDQIEAFEMILKELVAFAGGGRGEGGGRSPLTNISSDNNQPLRLQPFDGPLFNGSVAKSRSSPRDGIYIAPIQLTKSDREQPELPRQVVPPDDGGGGDNEDSTAGNASSIVTLFYSDNQSALGEQLNSQHQPRLAAAKEQSSPSSKQFSRVIVAKLNELPDDDDQAAILKQYFDVRRAKLTNSALDLNPVNLPADDIGGTLAGVTLTPTDESMSTTQAPANSNAGLITNWISRPLRDWSSYLFWSSATTAPGDPVNQSTITTIPVRINIDDSTDTQMSPDLLVKQETSNKQQLPSSSIQLLRPIDRTESYNTIPTNQTSRKQQQQQLILEIPFNLPASKVTTNNHRGPPSSSSSPSNSFPNNRENNLQALSLSGGTTRGNSLAFSSADLADQMSIPLTTLSDLVGSSSSVNMAEIGGTRSQQQSSTSNPIQHPLLRQQQQVNRPQDGAKFAPNSLPVIRPAYETLTTLSGQQPQMQIFRDPTTLSQQQQFNKNIQQHQNVMFNRQQQQQQNGQNQYTRLGEEGCDCGGGGGGDFQLGDVEKSSSPSNLFNVYTENCHRYCQSRLGSTPANGAMSGSTPSQLDSSPVTSFSTTSSTLLTTSGAPVVVVSPPPSGGKMNPLDVTFLLFTRRHRDLIDGVHYGDAIDLLQSGSSSPSTRNPSLSAGMNNGGGSVAGISPSSGLTTGGGIGGGGDEADRSLAQHSPNNGSYNIGLGELLDLNDEDTLCESSFNGSLPVKLIIHGFGSGGRRPWVTDMVYKLLDYENVNVIVVDWEKGATLPNYVQAAGNTRLVGHKIASLIRAINARHGLTASSYHLIGFSLGAHVAGFAGMEIRNSTSISHHWIQRITGLDPASPLFEGYEADDRLDPSDAQFVDVIHSNGDGVLRGGFGSLQPMGHVDFYPNGGRVQVGCNSVLLSALSDIIYGKWQSLCNHRRALNFFMDSFESFDNKCKFRSFNCDSYESYLKGDCFDCGLNEEKCSYMGYLANYSKGRGKMYLTTHEEAPFCGK